MYIELNSIPGLYNYTESWQWYVQYPGPNGVRLPVVCIALWVSLAQGRERFTVNIHSESHSKASTGYISHVESCCWMNLAGGF